MNAPIPQLIQLPVEAQLLPVVTDAQREQLETCALRANDEYLIDVVEKYSFCPFSREGRKKKETVRFIHWTDSRDLEPILELMLKIADDQSVAVAQVILPNLEIPPAQWLELCTALTNEGHRRRGHSDVLALAALHPDLKFTQRSEFSLIPLFRRSPDPTIQWVRLTSLEALYKGREKGSLFVDPADIMKVVAEPTPKPLYDRVAETNRNMLERLGQDFVVNALDEIRRKARREYNSILSNVGNE